MERLEALAHYKGLKDELRRCEKRYAEMAGAIDKDLASALADGDVAGAAAARKTAAKRRTALVEYETEITALREALPLALAKARDAAEKEFQEVVTELAGLAEGVMPEVREATATLASARDVLTSSWRRYDALRKEWAAHFQGVPSKTTPGRREVAQAVHMAAVGLQAALTGKGQKQ